MGNEIIKRFGSKIDKLSKELSIESAHLENKKGQLLDIDSSLSKTHSEKEIVDLLEKKRVLKREINQFAKNVTDKYRLIAEARTEHFALFDSKAMLSSLSDDYPFLLLPVRTEIRFLTVKTVKREKKVFIGGIWKTEKDKFFVGTKKVVDPNFSQETKKSMPFKVGAGTTQIKTGTISDTKRKDIPTGEMKEVLKEVYPEVVEDEQQLWVRIFPDDISISTHESKLTNDEYSHGINFWEGIWYLGNDEENQLIEWNKLCSKYGINRSMWIVNKTKPINYDKKPVLSVSQDDPLTEKPLFNTPALAAGRDITPKSNVMPDKFTAILIKGTTRKEFDGKLIPDPLIVGINSANSPVTEESENNSDEEIPDEIKWLTDFDEAEKIGMAMKIPLDDDFKDGFDKLLILGTKFSVDQNHTQNIIDQLFESHIYGNRDFSFLPNGFPTNASKANSKTDDADLLKYMRLALNNDNFSNISQQDKTDGQMLADFMGVSYEIVNKIHNYRKYDLKEAFAMNEALYPATLGYYLSELISPMVSNNDIASIKNFFLKYVTGRGHVTSLKLGSQPYGILPTSAFSKWSYQNNLSSKSFLNSIFNNFLSITLKNLINKPNMLKSLGNLQQGDAAYEDLFLEIIGLNASSVHYTFRLAFGPATVKATGNSNDVAQIISKYKSQLGYKFDLTSLIFELSYNKFGDISISPDIKLKIPIIDSNPFSESRKIENIFKTGNEYSNYIEWLRNQSFNNIVNESFLSDQHNKPNSLLYLLLRHSMLLSYFDTSLTILHQNQLIYEPFKREIEFTNIYKNLSVNPLAQDVKSSKTVDPLKTTDKKFDRLEVEQSKELKRQVTPGMITNVAVVPDNKLDIMKKSYGSISGNLPIAEYIDKDIKKFAGLYSISNVAKALEILKDLPTSRLERIMAEHLDLCSYRLDAWLHGLVNERLISKRLIANNRKTGSYLGSFGYLESIKPNEERAMIFREVLPLSQLRSNIGDKDKSGNTYKFIHNPKFNLDETFVYLGKDTVNKFDIDPITGTLQKKEKSTTENKGFIHAPSISHAVAAAILRCGYFSSKYKGNNNELAVNISSERSRTAMFYIDGINSGQDLAALLGYRFERSMHELSLDKYIYDFRLAFPFTINKINNNNTQVIERDYSQTVVNGIALIENETIDKIQVKLIEISNSYSTIPETDKTNISNIVNKLKTHLDAVGDLIMSESIFQLAQGNFVKSGSALNMAKSGEGLREPEILRTPATGTAVTHRLILSIDASDNTIIKWGSKDSLLSTINPYLNSWLAGLMGKPENIVITYQYLDSELIKQYSKILITELDLQPIDLFYLYQHDLEENKFNKIYNYVKRFLKFGKGLSDPVIIKKDELTSANEIHIEDLSCILSPVKEILLSSRPLKSQDFELPGTEKEDMNINENVLLNRVEDLISEFKDSVTNFSDALLNKDSVEIFKFLLNYFQLEVPDEAFEMSENVKIIHEHLLKSLTEKIMKVNDLIFKGTEAYELDALNPINKQKFIECLLEIIKLLTNNEFPVLTGFLFTDSKKMEIDTVLNHSLDEENGLLSYVGKNSVFPWLQGISKVRQKVNSFNLLKINNELLNINSINYQDPLPVQFPIHTEEIISENNERSIRITDKWVGHQYPVEYKPSGNLLSIITDFPVNYRSENNQTGLMIDEWTELIPNTEELTGIAFNFNQPDSEPPQTILLAVAPQDNGVWSWEDLADSVLETFELAKIRTLTPDNIWGNQNGDLSQVLPALFSASSFNPKESTTVVLDSNTFAS
ncbi:MAG TPA: hypothetical protein PK850_12745 [Ignavibacteria bacterium]|nr:hypothetical protein [Ignavibacteria bacterium]